MRFSGNTETGIEEQAAIEAFNHLKRGLTSVEHPQCSVKLPENKKYYLVVTPVVNVPGELASGDAYECHIYYVEAGEEAIQVENLMQRLHAGFSLSEGTVNTLSPLYTPFQHSDSEKRTFDYSQGVCVGRGRLSARVHVGRVHTCTGSISYMYMRIKTRESK